MAATRELAVSLARHEERIESIERHQSEHDTVVRRLEDKLDGLSGRLLTVAGGVIASLVLLAINLVLKAF